MAKEEKGTCKFEKCSKPVQAKGYCSRHYKQWRQGKLAKARYKICGEEGCRKKQFAKGYCKEHYETQYLRKTVKPAEAAPEPEGAKA